MATPARRIALRILREVDKRGSTLADLLATRETASLDPRERAFLHELVFGTLRHRAALDHALAAVVDRPLAQVDGDILAILRLGASQLLRMRVPAHAAVAESVELARSRSTKAAPFVNAVLRRLSREGAPPYPDEKADPIGWIATAGSLPRWLAERWVERLGAEKAIARARALLETPATVLRFNPRIGDAQARAEAAGLTLQSRLVPGAWEARGGRSVPELAAAAVLYVQDEGSQLIAHVAAAPGMVLDACAAPGGKTTLIADLQGATGSVIAAEPSSHRLRTMATLVSRWGATNVRPVGADILRPPFRRDFDSVLLDAPCSGLGTLARHPDIRWHASPEDVARQAERQRAMIQSAATLVARGGRLVYATCSSEPEENENIVEVFLQGHPAFATEALPTWIAPFSDGRFARTLPEAGQGDAFFVAVLRRS